MTLEEARSLIGSSIWPKVRDRFLATGTFVVYPTGDRRRLEYLDPDTQKQIVAWQKGLRQASAWRTVVDGAKVRELKAAFPGVYPEAIRYAVYFERDLAGASGDEFPEAALRKLLKMKFPEAYMLCFGEPNSSSQE